MALVSAAAVVVIVLVIALTYKPAPGVALVTPPPNAAVLAGLADGESLGKADAPVTLEVWSDFQCPVCGRLVTDYSSRLATEFIVPGQVRLVAHDVQFIGKESLDAAVAARCAGAQGKYWEYHDWIFYNQNGENLGTFNAERLALFADNVGLDRTTWDACIADPSQAAAVRAETTQATSQGILSTPTFRFGDQELAGLPRTYADLASAIRSVLPSGSPSPAGS
jgi:protein-disulfide isomerase